MPRGIRGTKVKERRCLSCKKSCVTRYVRCRPCRKKAKQEARNIRAELRDAGICIVCHRASVSGSEWACQGCADRARRNSLKRVRRLKRKRICIHCGKAPAIRYVRCDSCNDIVNKRRRVSNKRRTARLNDGRLRLFEALRDDGSMTLKQLAEATKLTTRTALRHLPGLIASGKVAVKRESLGTFGYRKIYMYRGGL